MLTSEANVSPRLHLNNPTKPARALGPEVIEFFLVLERAVALPQGAGVVFNVDEAVPRRKLSADDTPPRGLLPVEDSRTIALRAWQIARPEPLVATLDAVATVVEDATGHREGTQVSHGDLSSAQTVMQAATMLTSHPDAAQRAFRRCFACLQDFDRAYCSLSRVKSLPLTLGDVHPLVVFTSRSGTRWSGQLSIYRLPHAFHLDVPALTNVDEADELFVRLKRLRQHDPLALHVERLNRATVANSHGDFGEAVVSAAIAVEILFDSVLGMLLWDSGANAQSAVGELSRPLAERVRSSFHPRLGGVWQPAGNQKLDNWHRDLAQPRGRVVHRGHQPAEREAAAALAAAHGVREFVLDRVIERRFTYLRTALMLVGEPGLRRRGVWGTRLAERYEELKADADELIPSYVAWREGVDAAAREGAGGR